MSLITPLLGPVDDNIYYKRDDLYCPWGDVNGGKVRQAEALFETEEVQSSSGVIASVSDIHLQVQLSVEWQKNMESIVQ